MKATEEIRRPITKAALRKNRKQPISCVTPGGFDVTVRPPNIELHALSGGLPARLREMASQGLEGIDAAITASDGDPDLMTYLGGVIVRTLVEPQLVPPIYAKIRVEGKEDEVALVSGDDLDEYLLPVDYKWLLLIAFGEVDTDGTGVRLWGREPLSRLAPFREEHSSAEGGARPSGVEA